MPFIEPDKEGLAYIRNVRGGLMSLSEVLRERGYDPETVLAEIARDMATLDRLKLVLDSDPRKATQAGQLQGAAAVTASSPPSGSMAEADRLLRLALARTLVVEGPNGHGAEP